MILFFCLGSSTLSVSLVNNDSISISWDSSGHSLVKVSTRSLNRTISTQENMLELDILDEVFELDISVCNVPSKFKISKIN